MGTAEFAEKSLNALCEAEKNICCVVTKPDMPRGRGMKIVPDVVKSLAISRGTPVYQPENLRDGRALAEIKAFKPDIITVVSYGKILPPEILAIPPLGCINIHGSLLPKYRGSAPVQWAVINGEKETGVTSIYMAEGMDTGDIIASKRTSINDRETAGILYSRLAGLGAQLLIETLDLIENGTAGRTPQDDAEATYAPPLTRDMSAIDWKAPAAEILSKIRGLNPWPTAKSELAGIEFKIFAAEEYSKPSELPPGTAFSADNNGIAVSCLDGAILITELQATGGKRMSAADFLRGHSICL